jgi:hypothetical protein
VGHRRNPVVDADHAGGLRGNFSVVWTVSLAHPTANPRPRAQAPYSGKQECLCYRDSNSEVTRSVVARADAAQAGVPVLPQIEDLFGVELAVVDAAPTLQRGLRDSLRNCQKKPAPKTAITTSQ